MLLMLQTQLLAKYSGLEYVLARTSGSLPKPERHIKLFTSLIEPDAFE